MGAVRVLAVMPAIPPAKKSKSWKWFGRTGAGCESVRLGIQKYKSIAQSMTNNQLPAPLPTLIANYHQALKNTLSTKLTLIESLIGSGQSLRDNPSFLLSKFSTKTYRPQFPIDPGTISLTMYPTVIAKLFGPIYEYMDVRVSPVNTILEGGFKVNVEELHQKIEQTFKNVQLRMSEGVSLGEVMLTVNNIVNTFVAQLLQKIEGRKVNIRGFVDEDDIQDVKRFIVNKVNKEQSRGISDGKNISSRQNRLNFVAKTEQSPKQRHWIFKRLPAKKEPTSPLVNLQSTNNKIQRIFWRENTTPLQHMYDETIQIQSYVAENYKLQLQKNYGGLLNLDEDCYVKKNEIELGLELDHRNIKNRIHIDTYLTQYQRKLRRKARRQTSDRSYRGTAKTAKKIDKADDIIFSQKIDSMHNISTKCSQTSRKTEAVLQLPAINVRHFRRTTAEK